MTDDNMTLYVASYSDATTAKDDFEALKAARGDDLAIIGAVVMSRDADGNVDVLEIGAASISSAVGSDTVGSVASSVAGGADSVA